MKLSILTVCLNSQATIADTITSVLNQEFTDFEYIIFDGGSTDSTVDIVRSFGNRIQLIQGHDKGIFDAMNQAIGCASGDIIGILNSDDFYSHSKVLKKVNEQFDSTGTDSVYGDLLYVQRENTRKLWRDWVAGNFDKNKFKTGWAPPHPTFFVKKRIYEKYGIFDSRFDISGDYELLLRFLYRYDVSTTYIPEYLVHMRAGGNSSNNFKSRLKSLHEDRLSWRRNNLKQYVYTIPCKVLRKIPQYMTSIKRNGQ